MRKIVVTGADGRMGKALIQAICDTDDIELVGAVCQASSSFIGIDAGELIGRQKLGVKLSSSIDELLTNQTTIIDFTAPAATLGYLESAKRSGAQMVIGTTGFSEAQLKTLQSYAQDVAFVFAGNYSVGVNLSLQLLRIAAKTMGDEADIEVIEAHHKHKVDAPSGTALMMGQAAADGLGVSLSDVAVYAREGITGARKSGTIGFSAIRAGDIVGEHTVMFASEGERFEISHKASSRQTFARGAVRAVKWLAKQEGAGQFSMEDVLGFTQGSSQ